MLRWGDEGFEDVRLEQRGGVLGGGGLDVAVEDGDWGWDGCCWALLIENVLSVLGFVVEGDSGCVGETAEVK